MKKVINKLVRANIPSIIENDNKKCNVTILNNQEYEQALLLKLLEESNELSKATSKDSIIEEIADVMEVLDAIEELYDIDHSEILTRKNNKAKTKGRFNSKVYLKDITEINEKGCVKFKLIGYNKLQYPKEYEIEMREIAAHLDKTFLEEVERYSLHTEYSYGKRELNSTLLDKYPALKNSHKGNIPQLWKSNEWANEFALFVLDLTKERNKPSIIEVHPPFRDYCTLEEFIERYTIFEKIIHEKYPDTVIVIENRAGTLYRGKNFLVSTTEEIVTLCKSIKEKGMNLGVVLDVPQLITAEQLDTECFDTDKYLECMNSIKEYRDVIKGIHIWGKKKGKSGRWIAHSDTLDTYFNNNEIYKNVFLEGIRNLCNDGVKRYLVPEVNSGSKDLEEILMDLDFILKY